MADFKYSIDENFNFVIEEHNNAFIALRKIGWGEREPKLDLRKWYSSPDGTETMSKGVSFTDEGANELVKVLIENGYGHTNEILDSLKNRDDFRIRLNKTLGKSDPDFDSSIKEDDIYYDPKTALFGEDSEIA